MGVRKMVSARVRVIARALSLLLAFASLPCVAKDDAAAPAGESAKDQGPHKAPPPKVFTRTLNGTFGGQHLTYVATAGETYLKDDKGEDIASLFSVSYVRTPADAARPVTFVFNGGPGS